jgi:exosortase B
MGKRHDLPSFALIGAGLALLLLPTLYDLFNSVWITEEQGHGPIVLAVSIWLIIRNWGSMLEASTNPSRAGWWVLFLGLLFYLLGRSQQILLFEAGSIIPLVLGLGLLLFGGKSMRVQWFAFFFMAFMVPLPGIVVETLTMPMKMLVSYVAEHIMYWMGYPVSRAGVILYVGQYQLLVADACAGLHTLFTLEALGLLYLNLVRRQSLARNVALAVMIVPISFAANSIRVITLSLITYHFGDEAGQGFLHGFAGMVLFLSALALIVSVDSLLHLGFKVRRVEAATGGKKVAA